MIMLNYIFGIGSLLVAGICLFLSRNTKYYASVERKYGEAAAQKMTRSLRTWGYFFLITSGILIVVLFLERVR
jgi:hypothetical protein